MEKHFDFKIGDQVWLIHDNRAVCGTIAEVWYTKFISCLDYESIEESEAYYVSVNDKRLYDTYRKKQLFFTKADLKKSL